MLWEISGNNLENPSYIYGTMHVSKKIAFHLSDTFFHGIENVDLIALETNPSLWMDEMIRLKLLENKYNYFDNPNFYNETFPFKPIDNEVIASALSYEHSIINPILYRNSNGNQDFEEQTFLDMFIYQAAKKNGKEVVGLEDFEKTRILVLKSYIPDDNDKKQKHISYADRRKIQQKIEYAYRNGDLDLLDSLMEITANTSNHRKYMLDIRNRIMVDRIDSILHYKSMFIGVGAAHLPGDSGMIEMLRLKGYTVRPIKRNVTNDSRKKIKKIQDIKLSIDYNRQFTEDSAISLLMPGKLYKLPSKGKAVTYFFPEMTNGTAYLVNRLKTYAAFYQISANDLYLKIDSLLYENIPGNITKKVDLDLEYGKGFDIYNKTKSGDEQIYRILITPFEIIIFKIGNSGELPKKFKKEMNNVIKSISVNKQKNGWSKYTHKYGEFEIDIPNNRLINAGTELSDNKSTFEIQAIDNKDTSFYIFKNKSLYDFKYIEQDSFELNIISEKFAEEMNLKLIERSSVFHQQNPALNAKYHTKENKNIYARFIIKGAEYYMLLVKCQSPQKAEIFFNSFIIKPYKYEGKCITITDSSMLFKVDLIDIEPQTPFQIKTERINNKILKIKRANMADVSYKSNKDYKSFRSKSTNEEVSVYCYKHHLYYNTNLIDKYWDFIIYDFLKIDKSDIIQKDSIFTDSSYTYTIKLGDSASSRYIKHKIILFNGSLYRISAMGDTLNGESDYVKTFFDSFKAISDTNLRFPVFTKRNKFWIHNINETDSLQKDWAINSVKYVKFDENDFDSLTAIYKRFDFSEYEDFKSDLLSAIQSTNNKNADQFLINVYNNSKTELNLHFDILEYLAKCKTDKAHKFIKTVLLEEPPLNSEPKVRFLFAKLSDSLELCTQFFPEFFELRLYHEYELSTNLLLTVLVDSGLLSKDIFENKLSYYVHRGNSEIRRHLIEESSNKNNSFYRNNRYSSFGNRYYFNEPYDFNKKEISELFMKFSYPSSNNLILNYANLLSHFKERESTNKFYTNAIKSDNKYLISELVIFYLKNEINVPDSLIKKLSQNINYRGIFYEALHRDSLTSYFDSNYLHKDSMIMAKLFGRTKIGENDSLVFIEKIKQHYRHDTGYIYLYKSKQEKSDYWYYSFAFVIDSDEDVLNIKANNIFRTSFSKITAETKKEMEEDFEDFKKDALNYVRFYGRKRYKSNSNNYDYHNFIF